jgi:hypothetical protein
MTLPMRDCKREDWVAQRIEFDLEWGRSRAPQNLIPSFVEPVRQLVPCLYGASKVLKKQWGHNMATTLLWCTTDWFQLESPLFAAEPGDKYNSSWHERWCRRTNMGHPHKTVHPELRFSFKNLAPLQSSFPEGSMAVGREWGVGKRNTNK